MKATGIYNELKQPAKQFTLFIPTNDALARFQAIVSSNDVNLRKQVCQFLFCFVFLLARLICFKCFFLTY
jgi:hypothetical protein